MEEAASSLLPASRLTVKRGLQQNKESKAFQQKLMNRFLALKGQNQVYSGT